MKAILTVAFVLLFGFTSFSQLTNTGFEQWESRLYFFAAPPIIPFEIVNYTDPDGWTSINHITTSNFFGNKINAEESTAAVEGMSSAKLITDSLSVAGFGSFAIPGILINGEFEIDLLSLVLSGGNIDPFEIADVGQPYTQKPSKVTGYYRYNPVGADSCIVSVLLMNQGNPVGGGVFINGTDTDTNFVFFEADISYFACDVPDTVIIVCSSSSISLGALSGLGSTLYIDSIDLFVPPGGFNTAPIANEDSASGIPDISIEIDVLQNDEDCENDMLTVAGIIDSPSSGSATVNANGTITYDPNPLFMGVDELTYVVCDPAPLCDTAVVSILIDNGVGVESLVEDAPYNLFYNNELDRVFFKAGQITDAFTISIYNLNGREVLSENDVIGNTEINITYLPKGMYIVRVLGKNEINYGSYKFIHTN